MKIRVRFGIGGMRYGPEFEESERESHILVLNKLCQEVFTQWEPENPSPSIGITLCTAGKFEPDLVTNVGKPKYSKKWVSIDVPISLSLDSFQQVPESDFRNLLNGMLIDAFDQVIGLIEKKGLPYPAELLKEAWENIRLQYMDLPLPIVFVSKSAPSIPSSGVDYYFYFDKKRDQSQFLKHVGHLQLVIETGAYEGQHSCVLTDANARKVNKAIEEQLAAAADKFCGEYDGWSAPEV